MYRHPALRWFLFAFSLLLVGPVRGLADDLPKARPEAVGFAPDRLQRIDTLLTEAVERKHIAGGVVLLARQGKVAYLQAIGQRDIEAKQPMTPDTLFRIASMTKPITSVAVMILVEEGKLRLDDPLSKHLPEFKDQKVAVRKAEDEPGKFSTVPVEREITIRDLLTHTAGLTYGFFGKDPVSKLYRQAGVSDGLTQTEGTLADNIRRLAPLPLVAQPGKAWEYGLATDVLGRVIEVVSGKDLDTFFGERIFRPLRMPDTMFFLDPEKKPRLAAVYTAGKDKTITRTGEEPVTVGPLTYSASWHYRGPRTYFSGGAGLLSTASDYARFLQMLLGGGELAGVRLLKPETVRQMTTNQVGNLTIGFGDKFGYGFGVLTEAGKEKDVASVGTYSWGGFFHTYFWVDPKKELIGILLTQLYPSSLTLGPDLKKLAYEALADRSGS